MGTVSLKLKSLGGRTMSAQELERVRSKIVLPDSLLEILAGWPIIGIRFTVRPSDDESQLGVRMRWMDAEQMITEATEAFPGIVSVRSGYIPIGICLEGTGDPYFYRSRDGAVVRIPHEAAVGGELHEGQVEVVARSVDLLIEVAETKL